MPRYTVMYEVVESYDASIDVDSLDDLTAVVEYSHYDGSLDRSWREATVRITDIWRVDDEG